MERLRDSVELCSVILAFHGPEDVKRFSYSTQLSMKFSRQINMKIPTMIGFLYLLADKFSCSAMFSKKEFAIVSNLRIISRTNFMLS